MTVETWLRPAVHQLQSAGIGTARLDALVLLEDVTEHDRSYLLAHPELELFAAQEAELQKLLTRRAQHEPLAYVRGHTEFYGRTFVINCDVLEPRPESETMIELLKALVEDGLVGQVIGGPLTIADIGTGSGALGITAALEVPQAQVSLLDIDPKALMVAKMNVDKLTPSVSVAESDLLTQTNQDYTVLLCNLPYVPDDYQINIAASHEPAIAIFGGPDGLDLYRRLFVQIEQLANRPLYIITEALPPQHAALQVIAAQAAYSLAQTQDFIQVFRLA